MSGVIKVGSSNIFSIVVRFSHNFKKNFHRQEERNAIFFISLPNFIMSTDATALISKAGPRI